MPSPDLAELVDQARAGDAGAWGKVYEALAPSVFRLCRRVLPTREDAEDAMGEVLLKARLRLSQYDSSRPFEPWIFKIAANHCWDQLRKQRTRGELEATDEDVESLEDDAPSPQQAVLTREGKRAVRKAVAQLDDRSRLALVMRYYGEMSYEEIGEVLGISSSFVGVLLLRARRALRKTLER